MLDNLYENIGGKIKNWAKWIFIIEAICAVFAGIVMMANASDFDDIFFFAGLLTIIFGPVVAWVGSWILYAFGELVEDVHAIRNKEGTAAEEKAKVQAEENVSQSQIIDNLRKATQCECGELHYARYCPVCGKRAGASISNTEKPLKVEDKPQPKSTICKCGERFYGDICPNCGRNVKDL